jgi:hypothetical protein
MDDNTPKAWGQAFLEGGILSRAPTCQMLEHVPKASDITSGLSADVQTHYIRASYYVE